MIKYISKLMDRMDLLLVLRVNCETKNYFNNNSGHLFRQAIKILFLVKL